MQRRHIACTLLLLPTLAWPKDQNSRAEKALTELLFSEEADEFTACRFAGTPCQRF